ncbi:hypothetical protein QWZ13_09760 [Reinekea marina]|uniref:PepSY domain-containing protein n=1 Tax=Reinekea marina TaxID=1310421 RepID=A0ABV7WUS3_9GAMM|nr:hypothetical protein [Reinekea marina]MBU2862908.1 hypothetical protein [Reinekea forsetii]MDN3649196.1 hypothetical protein [Reinekea marina]
MKKMILGVFLSMWVSWVAASDDWPDTHPCTHEPIPLTSENQVVAAVECIYQGRVAKVTKKTGSNPSWYYQLRVLDSGGRIKEVDIHPQTGLPINKAEREAVYEALNRRG